MNNFKATVFIMELKCSSVYNIQKKCFNIYIMKYICIEKDCNKNKGRNTNIPKENNLGLYKIVLHLLLLYYIF